MQTSAVWTDDDVLAAAAEWVWIPDGSEVVERDYTLVRRPPWAGGRVEVQRIRSVRPTDDLLDEVADVARGWGADAVRWAVADDNRELSSAIEARGASVVEKLDVLARLLDTQPDLSPEPSVTVAVVESEGDLAGHLAVNVEVWRDPLLDEERFAAELAEVRRGISERNAFRVLASVDGEPASTGGLTLAPGPRGVVARLWGAATIPSSRGRGAYRAVLAERLRLAAANGATLALVKGRVETSAPILARAGFRRYGGERHFVLPL